MILMRSKLWPEISARIWRVGKVWLCKCQSDRCPQLAKTNDFHSREAAVDYAKIVLGLD